MKTTLAASPSAAAPASLAALMRQHPLFFYFLMAYAFSWIVLIPFILSEWNLLSGDWTLAFALNPFVGPTLAAFIMNTVTEGRAGVLRLRHRLALWRVGWPWYAISLLGLPALLLLGIMVLPGARASFAGLPPDFLTAYAINFIVIFFVGGPLGEEVGWRGFALPRLQARFGALKGTLLLGGLWAFWHLPHFLTVAQRGGPGAGWSVFYLGLPVFFAEVMALTIVMTWVFNRTRASLFIAILLHASYNTFGVMVVPLFGTPLVTTTDLPLLLGIGMAALLILVLTRGRLDYQTDQTQTARAGVSQSG